MGINSGFKGLRKKECVFYMSSEARQHRWIYVPIQNSIEVPKTMIMIDKIKQAMYVKRNAKVSLV